jgi:Protein of unknown function (DUF4038)
MKPRFGSSSSVTEILLAPVSGPRAPVEVVFESPTSARTRVPAFSSGGWWRVRYAASEFGEHRYRAEGAPDAGGVVTVEAPSDPGLPADGGLRVARDGRHLETVAGRPFLWLADTWWDALTNRVTVAELADLAALRAEQGFSVIQLVAGLYPEMEPFGAAAAAASGWAWEPGFAAPNEAWFDEADQKLQVILEHQLVPCIVGAWGFYLQHMPVEGMMRHWRELIARWAAYPVVWCLAGEVTGLDPAQVEEAAGRLAGQVNPAVFVRVAGRAIRNTARSLGRGRVSGFPDSRSITNLLGLRDAVTHQVARWREVAAFIRHTDPFGRPMTVHPQPAWPPYEVFEDHTLFDFWMLQTGHSGFHTIGPSVQQLEHARAVIPRKPVLVAEVCYEGILGSSWHEIQRFLFWSHLLSGAAGHTYGAQGLWGFNTEDYPGGSGGRWNELRWREAAHLSGARHLALAGRILSELPWHELTPEQDSVRPRATRRDRVQPYAAGRPGGPRVIYFPVAGLVHQSLGFRDVELRNLGSDTWTGQFINPRTGRKEPSIDITADHRGTARLGGGPAGSLPSKEDWVLVLSRKAPQR